MPDKYELFRSSLSVPLFENINQSLFQLLQTPKYQEYTDMIFSTLGQELENYFKKDMIFKSGNASRAHSPYFQYVWQ